MFTRPMDFMRFLSSFCLGFHGIHEDGLLAGEVQSVGVLAPLHVKL